MLLKTQVGDLKGFTIEIIKNILYLIGVGYFGGSIMALSSDKEFRNKMFPTDTSKLPYRLGEGQTPQESNGDILEYLFPMKSVGFPYNFLANVDEKKITTQYKNWMILTAMNSFSLLRLIFKKFYDFCSHFTTGCKRTIAFYLFPYILIGTVATLAPFLIVFIPVMASLWVSEIKYSFIFTFSIFLGWTIPLYAGKPIRFITLILMMIAQMIMFAVVLFIQLPYTVAMMSSLYVYCYVIILFLPFFMKDGLKQVFSEISHHKQSLTLYFLYLTIMTARKYLLPPIVIGFMLGSLFVAYKVFFPKKKV
jgi:hypothetical protein